MSTSDNRYIVGLQEQKVRLEACQQSMALNSCMKCEKLLACELRNSYVKSVYESMSHGETGGFEF